MNHISFHAPFIIASANAYASLANVAALNTARGQKADHQERRSKLISQADFASLALASLKRCSHHASYNVINLRTRVVRFQPFVKVILTPTPSIHKFVSFNAQKHCTLLVLFSKIVWHSMQRVTPPNALRSCGITSSQVSRKTIRWRAFEPTFYFVNRLCYQAFLEVLRCKSASSAITSLLLFDFVYQQAFNVVVQVKTHRPAPKPILSGFTAE